MAVFMELQLLSIMFKTIFKNLIFNTIDTNQPDQSDLLMELGTNKKKLKKKLMFYFNALHKLKLIKKA